MGRLRGIEKVEHAISEGKLGTARDCLHGLVLSYPEDLQYRSRLGDVYFMLGYPIEAGRFWFLDKDLDDAKQAAVDLFVQSCSHDPSTVLRRLKIRTDTDSMRPLVARERIEELVEECKRRNLAVPEFGEPTPETPPSFKMLNLTCSVVGGLIIALIVIGAYTVVQWIAGVR